MKKKNKNFFIVTSLLIIILIAYSVYYTANKSTTLEIKTSLSQLEDKIVSGDNFSLFVYSDTCPPCIEGKKELKIYSQENKKEYYSLNSEESETSLEAFFEEYSITVVPTYLQFNNGRVTDRTEGFTTEQELNKIDF